MSCECVHEAVEGMRLELEGRRALVVGAGKSGLAAARLLEREGAAVTIADRRSEGELADRIALPDRDRFSWRFGEHRQEEFAAADLVVVSPGVPSDLPGLAAAAERKTPVIGELELGFLTFQGPIYAVTGSNGKSTTTSLAGEMLKASGRNVFVGGNLGTPLCEAVLSGTPWQGAVVEVSSFQLETIRLFRPRVAALLNITPNHLDRYRTMGEYISSKRRIFSNQTAEDFAVLNASQPVVLEVLPALRSRAVLFGAGGPFPGGVWSSEGRIWTGISGTVRPLMDISEIHLPGGHNVENVMAAAAVAILAGASDSACGEGVRRFLGLPHRLERVREREGVLFYNDSKATSVDAMIRSIESFDRPVVLIAGGRSKGGDFSLLARAAGRRLRAAILIGEAGGMIRDAIGAAASVTEAGTMEDAVRLAANASRPGDVVLLAPGCSSFDMFRNFEERGDVFKEAVRGL